MVDWKSPAEIQKDGLAFDWFIHALLGVYVWEWLISMDFDWQFISGKKRFKWPMVFYFLNRYTLLFALIGIVIALDVTTKIDCQALFGFNELFGGTPIGFASINLSLRTMAVWSRKWYIVFPLVALILGHFALILHGVLLKAEWVSGLGCVITKSETKGLVATYIYSMIFDFIIMSLMAIKLVSPSSLKSSRLKQLIFQDGLIYFILVFFSNLVATIFLLLNLNPVMSIIGTVPSTVVSTILACRVVRRLSNFDSDHESAKVSSLAFLSRTSGTLPTISTRSTPKEDVHVQIEILQTPALEDPVFAESDAPCQLVKLKGNPQLRSPCLDSDSNSKRVALNDP